MNNDPNMNKSPKLSILYSVSFMLLFFCIALFILAIVFMMVIEERIIGTVITIGGVAVCLIAIIMAMLSKPQNPKPPAIDNSYEEKYMDVNAEVPAVNEIKAAENTEV